MKTKYFYLFLLIISIGFLSFSAFYFAPSDGNSHLKIKNKDIIKFSHSTHAQAVECQACHINIPDSKSLADDLYPDKKVCSQCHDVEDKNDCTKCHYDGVFKKLEKKKTNLVMNHKLHVTVGKMNCSECHKGLAEVNYSYEAKNAHPEMSKCYECHNNQKVTNECELCHQTTANLLPQNHKLGNFKKLHKFALASENSNCSMCHDENFCDVCHIGTAGITESNTRKSFYEPVSPYNYSNGIKQQKISRTHDLNYVYSHGVDANTKTNECKTCHQSETYCNSCHNFENNSYTMSGTLPASHKLNGFVTIGVGSGGGEHARLASRNIEQCASCHDPDGTDQVCTLCHLDNDGIKGTNPKTHKKGFMKDVRGDWHDSQGSMCFVCHISAVDHKVSGQGFCGYCHSEKRK